jgi:hypothetical protein
MDIQVLYPGVIVYHGALEEPEKFIEMINSSDEYVIPWYGWYALGRQTLFTEYPHFEFERFPSKDQWSKKLEDISNPLAKLAADAFFYSTSDYVSKVGTTAPNWKHGIPSICMYEEEKKSQQLAMQYHTDFIMSQAECPGFKHWVTCNIYLNDDYVGGELSFKVFKDTESYDVFRYKPLAGDAVIFPSHSPYYHGVTRTVSGKKYFIRMFWGYEYPGSNIWLDNERLYGKDVWAKMEKQRIDTENKSSMWMKGHIEEF